MFGWIFDVSSKDITSRNWKMPPIQIHLPNVSIMVHIAFWLNHNTKWTITLWMHVTIDKCLLHCFVVHDSRRMFYFWKAFSCKRNGGCEYQPTCLQWKECNDDGTTLCTAIHSSKGFIIKSWATLGMDLTCVRKRSTVAVYQNSPMLCVWVPCETVCGAFDMNFILHCRGLITYDQRVFQPWWNIQTSFILWHDLPLRAIFLGAGWK